MAKKFAVNRALARSQVDSLTVGGTLEVGDEFKVTLTAEDGSTTQTLTVVCTTTVTTTTATEIATAFNNAAVSTHSTFLGLFENITAQANGSALTLTAQKPGVPFYCTVSTNESGGGGADAQTFGRAATTANRGPSDWNSVDNWSDGAVPVNSDEVIIDGRAGAAFLYGLNQSAVTLAVLDIRSSNPHPIGWWGSISGLTVQHFALKISATILTIGQPGDDGVFQGAAGPSRLVSVNVGSAASTIRVFGTATQGQYGMPPVLLAGTHASNTLTVSGTTAYVGVSVAVPGQSSTMATVINTSQAGTVSLGTGMTLTNVTQAGENSRTIVNTAVSGTTKTIAGTLISYGSGVLAAVQLDGGVHVLNNRTGAVVTALQLNGGDLDTSQDARSLTITATVPNTRGNWRLRTASQSQVTFTDGAIAVNAMNYAQSPAA